MYKMLIPKNTIMATMAITAIVSGLFVTLTLKKSLNQTVDHAVSSIEYKKDMEKRKYITTGSTVNTSIDRSFSSKSLNTVRSSDRLPSSWSKQDRDRLLSGTLVIKGSSDHIILLHNLSIQTVKIGESPKNDSNFKLVKISCKRRTVTFEILGKEANTDY